jgi:hypothetical protein
VPPFTQDNVHVACVDVVIFVEEVVEEEDLVEVVVVVPVLNKNMLFLFTSTKIKDFILILLPQNPIFKAQKIIKKMLF